MKLPPIPTDLDPELRACFADWLAWIGRGTPEGEPYSRSGGLCYAARCYGGPSFSLKCQRLFQDSFPFGLANYNKRYRDNAQHLDPARLAWVKATLEANPVKES